MNTSDYERFGELAPKAIAKRADAQELAELQAALENHPDLKQEFEMMKVEAAVLEEALPLFEDIEHPEVAVPPLPLERLRDEVRGASAQRSKAKARLVKLLPELTKLMTSGRGETERVRAEGLLAALEDFVLTGRSALERKTDAPEPTTATPKLKAEPPEVKAEAAAEELSGGHPVAAGRRAWWDSYVKTGGAEAELQVKLMTMEGRLNNALTHLNNCKDEALTVLNLIREEKNALGRRVAEKIAAKREKGS